MNRWLDPLPVNIHSLDPIHLPPLLKETLIRRGYADLKAAQSFLNPDQTPSTPFPGIEKAVDLLNTAIRKAYPICVWGDFDVDGQTSTALLVQILRDLNADVRYYIPIRGKENHGVHIESLKPIIDNGAKLLLTCDTGITAHEAIDYAIARGLEVIISDHHEPGETLPNASALLNPKLLPEEHTLRHLAGVGVAFKLAEALLESQGGCEKDTESQKLLDLVALGLIADVALLKGETRALAKKGIQKLRKTQRLGLQMIAELAGAALETLTEETIGFTFAPRLNALGRLGDANPAVELLLTNNPAQARVLAAQIEGLNIQRRLLTSQVFAAAEAQLRASPELLSGPVIVLSNPNWPAGIVGIVANKIVERFHKPAILLIESEDGYLRGSARSVEGLHITEAIATQKHILQGYGGHPMAAGLSLSKESLASFRRGIGDAVLEQLGAASREEPVLQIDAWLELGEINLDLAEAMESLAPYGAGNPGLILATRNVDLKSITGIGKTKEHLRLNVEDDSGAAQSLMWWGGAGDEVADQLVRQSENNRIDIAYSLRASSYQGQRQLTLTFVDFKTIRKTSPEIKSREILVVDLRDSGELPQTISAQVFAEGEDRKIGNTVDRYNLLPAGEMVVYTSPPGAEEMRSLLECSKPQKVYLIAHNPPAEKANEFLARLAGMAKYCMTNAGGKTSLRALAAATAQREITIQIGLEWLKAGGHVEISVENDEMMISRGIGKGNPYAQKDLFMAVRGLLLETEAYREFLVSTNDPKSLLNSL